VRPARGASVGKLAAQDDRTRNVELGKVFARITVIDHHIRRRVGDQSWNPKVGPR